jgi:hypothetical protein
MSNGFPLLNCPCFPATVPYPAILLTAGWRGRFEIKEAAGMFWKNLAECIKNHTKRHLHKNLYNIYWIYGGILWKL